MAFTVHPLTPRRMGDFADVTNPNRRATHCWCLSHRISPAEIDRLGQGSREEALRCLAGRRDRPGVIGYDDGVPVAWCSISPRTAIPRLMSSTRIRPVDDVPVWSIICVVVRSGHRRRGLAERVIDGAVDYARRRGAPAVEAYPADTPEGKRIDLTMAFVGTRQMFEQVGFEVVGTTDAVASSLPRLVMRRTLGDRA